MPKEQSTWLKRCLTPTREDLPGRLGTEFALSIGLSDSVRVIESFTGVRKEIRPFCFIFYFNYD